MHIGKVSLQTYVVRTWDKILEILFVLVYLNFKLMKLGKVFPLFCPGLLFVDRIRRFSLLFQA